MNSTENTAKNTPKIVVLDSYTLNPGDLNWDGGCDISELEDDVIDGLDLAVFVGNWLEGL